VNKRHTNADVAPRRFTNYSIAVIHQLQAHLLSSERHFFSRAAARECDKILQFHCPNKGREISKYCGRLHTRENRNRMFASLSRTHTEEFSLLSSLRNVMLAERHQIIIAKYGAEKWKITTTHAAWMWLAMCGADQLKGARTAPFKRISFYWVATEYVCGCEMWFQNCSWQYLFISLTASKSTTDWMLKGGRQNDFRYYRS